MKIGILTFHSQLNYGGVLQCWALQTALEKLGHEVVVIDRRLSPEPTIFGGIVQRPTARGWVKIILRALMFCGGFAWVRRCFSTRRFIRQNLHLTHYHFHEWADAPKDLGVDVLIVGSDQVWHCGDWGNPLPYLLVGAPPVPAIAYAASFGMAAVPERVSSKNWTGSGKACYVRGLHRFDAVSCREAEGVSLCKTLGVDAAHVVDPVLLAFYGQSREKKASNKRKKLICYLLGEEIAVLWDSLYEFAVRNHCVVEIFTETPLLGVPWNGPVVKSLLQRVGWHCRKNIRLRLAAGPMEFADALRHSDWVVSNSFHALMFSMIGNCNIRIIRPNNARRGQMFSRIQEFTQHTKGPLLASSVEDALVSLARGEEVAYDVTWLTARKEYSKSWLAAAIKRLNAKVEISEESSR